jgi:hypothetical protein
LLPPVLHPDAEIVPAADPEGLHVLHRRVRVVGRVGDLDRVRRIRDVDDVNAGARAGAAPLADEGEVLVAGDIAMHALVERAQLQRAHERNVARLPGIRLRRRLVAEVALDGRDPGAVQAKRAIELLRRVVGDNPTWVRIGPGGGPWGT